MLAINVSDTLVSPVAARVDVALTADGKDISEKIKALEL